MSEKRKDLEPAEMPNLPMDHPLRSEGICTDVDLMIALNVKSGSFEDYHKPKLRSRACNGKWALLDSKEAAAYVRHLMSWHKD